MNIGLLRKAWRSLLVLLIQILHPDKYRIINAISLAIQKEETWKKHDIQYQAKEVDLKIHDIDIVE